MHCSSAVFCGYSFQVLPSLFSLLHLHNIRNLDLELRAPEIDYGNFGLDFDTPSLSTFRSYRLRKNKEAASQLSDVVADSLTSNYNLCGNCNCEKANLPS
ncbi:hypothetical protein BKA67DRAFT_564122 [Truncatella angustata]|uniref:Uncharacterized protein n=1 Tax=Truncatella angustata TaxID=152316 RepID=A0A9P8UL58_9PEZI|nr:uncharacterized protein BKA67DRAFT_564122 [Truncatella angustata]KAH6654091.1 hypothetical protein BKA67DRAFT_564122 [Truncatella angustata]